jgi:hypothetical protein
MLIGLVLIIGAITPIVEINRSIHNRDKRASMNLETVLEMPAVYREQYIDYKAKNNWFYTNLMQNNDSK